MPRNCFKPTIPIYPVKIAYMEGRGNKEGYKYAIFKTKHNTHCFKETDDNCYEGYINTTRSNENETYFCIPQKEMREGYYFQEIVVRRTGVFKLEYKTRNNLTFFERRYKTPAERGEKPDETKLGDVMVKGDNPCDRLFWIVKDNKCYNVRDWRIPKN